MLEDIRIGLRSLTRSRGFGAVVIITLGVGIAAATLVFSIVNAALFRLYDSYPDADRLVLLVERNQRAGRSALVSEPDLAGWTRDSRSFDYLGGMEGARVTASWSDEPLGLIRAAVTRDVLPMLGARVAAGRLFLPGDFRAGAAPVVLLTHALWQRRLGGQPGMVGRTVTIDGQPRTVAGILDGRFRLLPFFGVEPDIVTVLPATEAGDRSKRTVFAVGRLRAGLSADAAEAEINGLMRGAAAHDPAAAGWSVTVRKARGVDLNGEAAFVVVLAAGVWFVLLIVCANVSNLMLGRAASRTRELATRLALGAGRLRLARQLLVESLLLGAAGCVVGLGLAYWACRGLSWYLSGTSFALFDISLDVRAAAFASIVSVACSLAAGLVPSMRSSRLAVVDNLKEGASSLGRVSPSRLRSVLVASEVALALVLLVGSGLVLRGLINLRHNDAGFVAEGLSSLAVTLSDDRYSGEQARAAYAEDAVARLERQPGIEAAATSFLPMAGAELPPQPFALDGRGAAADSMPSAGLLSVSSRFFSTMRIPLRAGRAFGEGDRAGTLPVAIVDERLVAKWIGGRSPLGRTIRLGAETRTIVGVVGAVRHFHLNVNPAPAIYVPFAQRPTQGVAFVLRTPGADPSASIRNARAVLASLDRHQVVRGGRRMTDVIAETLGGFNMTSMVVAILASVALGLSAIGIYSVVAYSIARRKREFGVRMALGASPHRLVREILGGAVRMTAAGAVPGLLLSLAVGKLLSTRLHRVSAVDAVVLVSACGAVLATVLLASYVPARRVARVSPIVATRCE